MVLAMLMHSVLFTGARQRESLAILGDHPIGRGHLEFVVKHLETVAAEIAHRSRSEVPPGAPIAVVIGLVIRASGRRAAPLVPIHPSGGVCTSVGRSNPLGLYVPVQICTS